MLFLEFGLGLGVRTVKEKLQLLFFSKANRTLSIKIFNPLLNIKTPFKDVVNLKWNGPMHKF